MVLQQQYQTEQRSSITINSIFENDNKQDLTFDSKDFLMESNYNSNSNAHNINKVPYSSLNNQQSAKKILNNGINNNRTTQGNGIDGNQNANDFTLQNIIKEDVFNFQPSEIEIQEPSNNYSQDM